MKIIHKGIVQGMVVLVLLLTTTWAENPKAVIIFDASGSMWGQVDGKAKISIAKEALQDVVKKWNPEVELGLTVYGHRTKGDCADIETVVPVGKVDKNKILNIVKNIQPKGKTPISATLKKVAKEMKFAEEKSTIILISDGKESCDADPCATAKELEKQGIDFVAHVIGFNVDKKTDAQLECIASATGGEYFSAKDATALNDAMDSIVKKVEEPKPEPKPIAKNLKYNVEITAVEKEGGKWLNSYHIIYRQGEDGKATGDRMTGYLFKTTKKEPLIQKLPLGKYILKSEYNYFSKETAFEIKASEVTKLNIIFGQTNDVEITAVEKEGGKWLNSYHIIYRQGEDGKATGDRMTGYLFKTTKKEPLIQKLPLGKYILKSEYNYFSKETAFEIKASEVTKLNIIFGQTNDVEITAVEKEGGKWINSYHIIYRQGEDGKATGDRMTGYLFKTTKKEPLIQKLPLGKYILKSEYKSLHKETQFEIKIEEVSKINVVFEQFVIKTKCPDMHSEVSYEVYASTGRMAYSTQKPCSEVVQLALDAGTYTVEAKIENNTKEKKFSIGGSSHELILDMTNVNSKEELIKADESVSASSDEANHTNYAKDVK